MTVPELKKALKAKGLSVGGVKQDLIERLQLAMASDEVRGRPINIFPCLRVNNFLVTTVEGSMPGKQGSGNIKVSRRIPVLLSDCLSACLPAYLSIYLPDSLYVCILGRNCP